MKLDELLTQIDSQVRSSAVQAHESVMEELGRIKPRTIVDVEIPANALIPRELLHPQKVAMSFDCYMDDDGVSLSCGVLFNRGGTKVSVAIEWEAQAAPEATALVRTKAEAHVGTKEINPHG